MKPVGVYQDDIVQIVDRNHHWFPCLVVVSDVKSWGIQGYVTIPTNDNEPNGNAYIRLETAQFDRVGRANVVVGDE